MLVGIPREIGPGERRVAATPETIKRLTKLGFDAVVESGAGEGASFLDSDYESVGARIIKDPKELWEKSDIVLK
ncbi:MAG: NAD(P)(+) transhydrogenase (Re/Si-specific) subunit alpha, partial [Myxococcales bacterium]|nr:NAD(P)(+) transhydrogenase (Re/Si-specific) subunit alpha [Myxococcales bacterium]